MRSSRTKILLALVIGGILFAVPHIAHANIFTDGLKAFTWTGPLYVFNGFLDLMNGLILEGINQLGNILQAVMGLKMSAGGPVVLSAWRLLRDFVNMSYIILLIIISFATIFNAVNIGFLKPYALSKSVITGFLISAILLNFSLAIGQAVTESSNKVTEIILGLFEGKNVGAELQGSLNVATLALKTESRATGPILDNIDPNVLTDAQKRIVENWGRTNTTGGAGSAGTAAAGAKAQYEACMKRPTQRLPAQECYEIAWNTLMNVTSGLSGAARAQAEAATAAAFPFTNPGEGEVSVALIISKLYKGFLFLVLLLSFFLVVLFMLIRIPLVWILLAVSPLAFASFAFPGSDLFDKWKKQFIAWQIFSPLYLLLIFFGLFMINSMGQLTASLPRTDAIVGFLAVTINYFVVALVFLGGTAQVVKMSQLTGTAAGDWVTRIQGGLGFDKETGAVGAVYSGIGLKARVTGAQKGLASVYERNISTPLKRREEEATARFQAKFGDRSAMDTLQRNRINEQIKKNKDEGVSIADLQKDFKAGPKSGTKYFAAAKALLDEDGLNPAQMNAYALAAAKVGRAYGSTTKEAVEKKLKDRAKDKKYKDTGEVTAALDIYKPEAGDTPEIATSKTKARDGILKGLEKNQPLIAAELVPQGLYPGKTAQQIVQANFSSLEHKDIIMLLDKTMAGGALTMDPVMDKLVGGRFRKLADYLNLVAETSTPIRQAPGAPAPTPAQNTAQQVARQAEMARIIAANPSLRPRP